MKQCGFHLVRHRRDSNSGPQPQYRNQNAALDRSAMGPLLNIQNPDYSGFPIPTKMKYQNLTKKVLPYWYLSKELIDWTRVNVGLRGIQIANYITLCHLI